MERIDGGRLLIATPDGGLVPDDFPLPAVVRGLQIADVEDPWIVASVPSPATPTCVEDPWWIEMAPTGGGDVDLERVVHRVREAPPQRVVGFRDVPPHLLSEQRFLVNALAAALAVSPGVVLRLTEP